MPPALDDGFRWLTEDEQRAWRALLTALQMLFEGLDRQLLCDSGVPHADYEVLVRLSEADNRSLRMSELAGNTLFSRSRTSHAVRRLEALGWVTRAGHPEDRRGTIATLTDKGFGVLEAAAPGHVDFVRRTVFEPLSRRQVDELRRIAERIGAALATDGRT